MTFKLFQMVSNGLENHACMFSACCLLLIVFSQEEEVKRVRGYFQTAVERHCDPDDENQASQARASFLDLSTDSWNGHTNLCEIKVLESKTKVQIFKLFFRTLKKYVCEHWSPHSNTSERKFSCWGRRASSCSRTQKLALCLGGINRTDGQQDSDFHLQRLPPLAWGAFSGMEEGKPLGHLMDPEWSKVRSPQS